MLYACMQEQMDVSEELTAVPELFDRANLTTSASTADGAATPMALGLRLSSLRLRRNPVSTAIEATFDFEMTMQWQDSRLETSPCELVYPSILGTTSSSSRQDLADAARLRATFWHPTASILSSDTTTFARVAYDRTQLELRDTVPWVTGTGPLDPASGAPFARCHKCAMATTEGTANVTLTPAWRFDYFPFDRHEIYFVISVEEAQLSSCEHLLAPMRLDANRSQMLPTTNEWDFDDDAISIFNPTPHSGAARIDQCHVVLRVRRNAAVYFVKSLVMTCIAVLLGLMSLYLHADGHTGDRAAMILVSALIVTEAFTKDLGLGKLQYLIWVDVRRWLSIPRPLGCPRTVCSLLGGPLLTPPEADGPRLSPPQFFNAAQLAILVPTLVLALYEHRMHVNERAKWVCASSDHRPSRTTAQVAQLPHNHHTAASCFPSAVLHFQWRWLGIRGDAVWARPTPQVGKPAQQGDAVGGPVWLLPCDDHGTPRAGLRKRHHTRRVRHPRCRVWHRHGRRRRAAPWQHQG
jgi:hypothetical protein